MAQIARYYQSLVAPTFKKIAFITGVWAVIHTAVGWLSSTSFYFYSKNCYSLFTMGSPVCMSAWVSHLIFMIAYVIIFMLPFVLGGLWLYSNIFQDPLVIRSKEEIMRLINDMAIAIIIADDEDEEDEDDEDEADEEEDEQDEEEEDEDEEDEEDEDDENPT